MTDAWKSAARHWWERMRDAERERDELRSILDDEAHSIASDGCPAWLFELGARIAEADAKHPRDLCNGVPESVYAAERSLRMSREDMRSDPTWAHALICEMREAFFEAAHGDMTGLDDELLDVATVAMRWRRAILERGAKDGER